jgi:dTDP-4-amino-4,6-dideoxy-D-galactose acyltransferase
MTSAAPCRFLEWDSTHFGRRIARVEEPRLTAEALRRVSSWCAAERIDCVYFLAAPGDEESARVAEEAGFQKVDVRITMERENAAPSEAAASGLVRPFEAGDLDRLRELARTLFVETRFYRDPAFDRARCAELYDIWITKACSGGADRVLVALDEGRPAGFLSAVLSEGKAKIDLVGVAESSKGKGLGRALVLEALRGFAGRPPARVSVVTQGGNAAAQKLYAGCGFRTVSEQRYFHGWFGTGGKGFP